MATLHIDISSLDDDVLYRDIIQQLQPQVEVAMRNVVTRIEGPIRTLVGDVLINTPEFQSLSSGLLREEFGLGTRAGGPIEGKDAALSVIAAIQKAVVVSPIAATGNSLGGLLIEALADDFKDALSSEWASYDSNGHTIDWLEWLLLEGDRVIIQGYEILRDYPKRKVNTRSSSRTGKVIMVKRSYDTKSLSARAGGPSKKDEAAFGRYNRGLGRTGPSNWRVPPEFAGTASNNWITRAVEPISAKIEKLLEDELNREFS